MFTNKLLLYLANIDILGNIVYLFKNILTISTQKLTIKHIELKFRHDLPIIIMIIIITMMMVVTVVVAIWRGNDVNGDVAVVAVMVAMVVVVGNLVFLPFLKYSLPMGFL